MEPVTKKTRTGLILLTLLRAAHSLTEQLFRFVLMLFLAAGFYAVYDESRILNDAGSAAEWTRYRPERQTDSENTTAEDEPAYSFEELQKLNPDVCAWITLSETGIDYPVVQGRNNSAYVNHDLFGEYSLSGSIFLDAANSNDFSDSYSLIYGHHMDHGLMFGALDAYMDESYGLAHRQGELILPDRTVPLTVVSCLVTDAYDPMVFPDEVGEQSSDAVLAYLAEHALYLSEDASADTSSLIALSTCLDSAYGRLMLFLAPQADNRPESGKEIFAAGNGSQSDVNP